MLKKCLSFMMSIITLTLFTITINVTITLLETTSLQAKTIIISDLDDTIRQSHILDLTDALQRLLLGVKPYLHLRNIYQELGTVSLQKNEGIYFCYISAAYKFFYNADKWLTQYQFPQGLIYQKKDISTVTFKINAIRDCLTKIGYRNNDRLLFFGDNAEYDPTIYLDVVSSLNIGHQSSIYIRDVKVEAWPYTPELSVNYLPSIYYFLTEKELSKILKQQKLISPSYTQLILNNMNIDSFIPDYILWTLEKRLQDEYCPKVGQVNSGISVNDCMKNAYTMAYKILYLYFNQNSF